MNKKYDEMYIYRGEIKSKLQQLKNEIEKEFDELETKNWDDGGWDIPYEDHDMDRVKAFLLRKIEDAWKKGSDSGFVEATRGYIEDIKKYTFPPNLTK